MTLCLIGGAVISGALAERAKFYVGVTASAVMGGLVFPVIGNWIWHGKLYQWGFIDFGGASAIHLSAAIFGAVGVAVLGSRAGKYNRDGSSNSISGHALPMLGLGAMVLFIGWFPYLLGCVEAHWSTARESLSDTGLAVSATNIFLAAMAGVAGGLIYSHHRYRKPDMFFAYSGMLGAMVAITPGVVAITGIGAVIIGIIAGIIVPMVALRVDMNARLDDPIGLITIHGVGAIWGTLATALLINNTARPSDHWRLLALQCLGLIAVIILSAVTSTVLFLGLKLLGAMRVSQADELVGLDQGEHDVIAYPEFQQITR